MAIFGVRTLDLRMDNDHPTHVMVWLKDLGESLPKQECEHWRAHNKVRDGGVSKTFYSRNIRGWFADPEMPDLRLKQLYPHVNKIWTERYGWPLWLQPELKDQYVFRQVHVCLGENQSEFDHQNGLLAKLVVDFLNAAKIKSGLTLPDEKEKVGLNYFETFLNEAGFAEAKERIEKLRIIQNLRSAGVAHIKGTNYERALKRGAVDGLPLVEASMKVFDGAVTVLEWVLRTVLAVPDNGPPPIDL